MCPNEPKSVVYIDKEMTPHDVRERLQDMGYGPETDLSQLHYYQLAGLPPLDSPLGGSVLSDIVTYWGATLVVIDTMSRVVYGDENVSDTYQKFYRYTGAPLKKLAAALIRLDHAGKDAERGQRGSSAKNDDVDIVFQLSAVKDGLLLKTTHSRVPWIPAEVSLFRQEFPLAHVVRQDAPSQDVEDTLKDFERLRVPKDASGKAAEEALRKADCGRRRDVVLKALKLWKERS
jgi:hypothetical protein